MDETQDFARMGSLNPGKSTVYVSNLPYDLKPPDIQKIFERFGRIIRVTLLTVKETRKSKGVAFILFHKPEDAEICVYETNNSEMLGNVLKTSIARDNGRRPNFKNHPPSNFGHSYNAANEDFNHDNGGYNNGHNYDNPSFENRPFHYKNPYLNNKPNYYNASHSNFEGNVNYRHNPNSSWSPYN